MEQASSRRKLFFWVQVLLGLALGLAALYLAARQVSLRELGLVLRGISLPWLGLTLISCLCTPVVKAIRWHCLFYPRRPAIGLTRLMRIVIKGNPQAGLPLLNGGAIAGFFISYLLIFGLDFSYIL